MMLVGETDANTERSDAGTVSFAGRNPFGPEPSGNPFGEGETGTGSGGDELFAGSGLDSGGADARDSGPAPRKRGRPKGSTNAAKSGAIKLTGERLAAARRKLTDTLAGVVGFGISYYGTTRAKKYKPYSMELAQRVYGCYQIDKDAAVSVGEPLADTFMTWFPQYVETTTKAIDPGLAVARLFAIFQQAGENEKIVVDRYRQQFNPPQPETNGTHAPTDTTQTVEETINQWNQGAPTPEEINPQGENYSTENLVSSTQ